MSEINWHELEELLKSESIEVKVVALDEGIKQLRKWIYAMLLEFERSQHRYFIYERLRGLGSMIVDPLKEIWSRSNNEECKVLAALIIARYDLAFVESFLVEQLRADNEYLCPVASTLAKVGALKSAERMIKCLMDLPISCANEIICLVDSLRKINPNLPEDVVKKLVDPNAPIDIKLYINKVLQG